MDESIIDHCIDFKKKQKNLKELRHEIKKKRILFNENVDKFGMDEFTQLVKVKNTSQIKGYPFQCSNSVISKRSLKLATKIIPIEKKFDKTEHPCYIEDIILKELTDNIVQKDISPHITYFLGVQKINNKARAVKHLNLKRLEVEEKIRTHSHMIISEYVPGGSLDNWIRECYEDDLDISDEQWKIMTFQIIYTMAVIQHYYKLMHNDCHYGNILIDNSIKPIGYFVYITKDNTYYIKNTGVIPKLFDFEFSMSYNDAIPNNYPNKFIIGDLSYDRKKHFTDESNKNPDEIYNVPYNYNKVYDLHYFLTSLLDLYISKELFDWIISLYPEELIPEEDVSTYTSNSRSYTESTDSDSTDSDSTDSDSNNSDSTENNSTEEHSISSSGTESHSSIDSSTNSETESSEESVLEDGRLINGVEKLYNLPTPMLLLNSGFFKEFTKKPDDFDEDLAIYFSAQI
jgi:hypothetical protein